MKSKPRNQQDLPCEGVDRLLEFDDCDLSSKDVGLNEHLNSCRRCRERYPECVILVAGGNDGGLLPTESSGSKQGLWLAAAALLLCFGLVWTVLHSGTPSEVGVPEAEIHSNASTDEFQVADMSGRRLPLPKMEWKQERVRHFRDGVFVSTRSKQTEVTPKTSESLDSLANE